MQITINGITKDCTEWGCENIVEREHGCWGFKARIKKGFKPRREFPLDEQGYKAFRSQGWNGEYEEIEVDTEIDNTNLNQLDNFMHGGSSLRTVDPSRIDYEGHIVMGQ